MMSLPYVHDKPRFCQARHAMGVHALLCTRAEDFGQKILEYDSSLPLLLECVVKNEHVFPMVSVVCVVSSWTFSGWRFKVPTGKAPHEQSLHPSLRK